MCECVLFVQGQCACKENVEGIYCDSCASLHYNLTLGCIDCNCLIQGTLDGVAACDSEVRLQSTEARSSYTES